MHTDATPQGYVPPGAAHKPQCSAFQLSDSLFFPSLHDPTRKACCCFLTWNRVGRHALDFASARLKADVEVLLEAVASYKPDLFHFGLESIQFRPPKTIRDLFYGQASPMRYTTVRSLVNDSSATHPPLIRRIRNRQLSPPTTATSCRSGAVPLSLIVAAQASGNPVTREGEPGGGYSWDIGDLRKAEGLRRYVDGQLQLHTVMVLCKIYPK